VFFGTYKALKDILRNYFDGSVDLAICYLIASCATEIITLSVKYPYDLIKCRLQSAHQKFKYRNLPDAFTKEITKNSFMSLYRGSGIFLLT